MTFLGSVRLALAAMLCAVTLGTVSLSLAPAASALGTDSCIVEGDSSSFDPSDCPPADVSNDPLGDSGSGIPGWFVAIFVLMVLVGIGTTIWRVSTARQLASNAGLDPDVATKVALMDQEGLSATYLASSLRNQQPQAPPASAQTGSAADRLAELKSLLDRGLITQEEHDARRKAIIDAV